MKDLIIPDSVYPYLRVQKGEINHIEDRKEFEAAYNNGLCDLFNVMLPHIPKNIKSSLDIGSGMGGIDILLRQYFWHDLYEDIEITLLDAEETPPICEKHDKPFNDLQVANEFFKANDCKIGRYITPENTTHWKWEISPLKFDLIFSVGSYCFHYSPEKYLQFVKERAHKDTVLIFDVRNRHTDWLEILRENFDEVAVLVESEKFTKRVFKVKC